MTPHEERFLKAAEQLGLLTVADAQHEIAAAEAIRSNEVYADIRTVLVGRRKLDADDADRALRAMTDVPVYCPACGRRFSAGQYGPGLLCPEDGAPVKPALAPDSLAPIKRDPSGIVRARKEGEKQDTRIGMAVGGFRLDSFLRVEGRRRVYLGRNEKLDSAVEIVLSGDEQGTALRRFLRGGKYAAMIEHPHVLSVYGCGELGDGMAYVVTEHREGRRLAELLPDPLARIPVNDVVRYTANLLQGLLAAHRIGIVHRNVKPTTVIIDGGNNAVLAGFELARVLEEAVAAGVEESTVLTEPGASIGTPHYMAPEQIQSSKVDARADLYALGSTVYHMLCGEPPFPGKLSQLLVKKLQQDPPSVREKNPQVAERLDHFILTLLARNPDARYPSAAHAIEALAAAVRG